MFLGCNLEGIQQWKNKHLLGAGCGGEDYETRMKEETEGGKKGAMPTEVKSRVFLFLTCGHFQQKTCKLFLRPVKSLTATAWSSGIESEETLNSTALLFFTWCIVYELCFMNDQRVSLKWQYITPLTFSKQLCNHSAVLSKKETVSKSVCFSYFIRLDIFSEW